MEPFETIYIDQSEVACDGGEGPLGHPRVYLHVDSETNQVMCGYCSRNFVLKAHRKVG